MKGKLIKTGSDYLLRDMSGEVLAITNGTTKGRKLSKQNCDEIFGVVDVDKLAEEWYEGNGKSIYTDYNTMPSFIEGFNKAIELNKDKVFTESDIRKAIEYGIQSALQAIPGVTSTQSILENFIQQPTEIEVEIEMEEEFIFDPAMGISQGNYITNKKLDENGCLILTKKI